MGLQQNNYDIISQRDRTSSTGTAAAGSRRGLFLKRVNGISEFSQVTRIGAPNFNKDYQNALSKDSNVFRRSQGVLSLYSNAAASHKFIIPAGKKA